MLVLKTFHEHFCITQHCLQFPLRNVSKLIQHPSTYCRLLDESREACPGHAMVVALHLYKLLKSSRKFTELMTTKFNETIKEVNCLKPIKDQFEV